MEPVQNCIVLDRIIIIHFLILYLDKLINYKIMIILYNIILHHIIFKS